MTSSVRLRPLTRDDAGAFAALLARSAGAGRFQTSSRFVVDPWLALQALHAPFDAVVAEVDGHPGLAGCGIVRYGRFRYEGVLRPFAFLNTLVVDPAQRRRGLASALAAWRVARARERNGADGVVYAGIQGGNAGSERTAARWATQVVAERIGLFPTPAPRRAPRRRPDLDVHPARPDELAACAAGLEAFYAGVNLHVPETAESLAAWRADTPFDTPWRELFVVTDRTGVVRAGLGLAEVGRLKWTEIVKMPFVPRLASRLTGLLPADRRMREVAVSRAWFAPGHAAAARHLWAVARAEWRARGTVFMAWSDERLPLLEVFRSPRWMPRTQGRLVFAGPVPLDERKALAFS